MNNDGEEVAADSEQKGSNLDKKFQTFGVSEREAVKYLKSQEGKEFLKELVDASPQASQSVIMSRALEQIRSGRELPKVEKIDEPLAKIVAQGNPVSSHSPYFTKLSEIETGLAHGHNLAGRFGLPDASEAGRYDVYIIHPKEPTNVFVSEIAPTGFDDTIMKSGGATQYLVPNRSLFTEAQYLKSVDNQLPLSLLNALDPQRSSNLFHDNPNMRRAAGVGAVAGLGAAASIYDARRTAERVGTLLAQDNPLAARSELQHFAARGVGGWVGGTLTAGLVGTSSATGIGLVLADAYLLSLAAERGADWLDHRSIVRQTDRNGVQWHYTGHAWQREARADLSADGVDNPQPVTAAASIEKDRELNYQASAAAAALAIRQASLQDPGVLPASGDDRASLRPAPWQRNVETGQWQRNVAVAVDRNDMAIREWQTATPERAAQLEAQATQVIAANLANGPTAIAARFEAAYRGNGWRDFGPLPEAVQSALQPDRLHASDGRQYQRDADGTWQHEGERANANRAWELERTRDALLPALAQHRQAIEQIPGYAAPTGNALREAHLQYMYRQHGTELNPDWRQAITAAVEQTRHANGLTESGAMQLLPNAAGKIAADSGIAHLRKDASGVEQVVATTTSEEIVAAWRAQKQEMAAETPRHSAMHAATASAAIASLPPMTVMPEKDRENDHQKEDRPIAHAEAAAITVRRGFPPEHPDAPLRQAIKELLPSRMTEEWLTEITVAARTAGIRAHTFKGITVHPADEMKLVLHGTIPGFMATVDLRQGAPTQQDALQRLDAYHEQQAQRQAEFQQQQERANAWERVHGPGPGGPSAPGLGM